MHVLHSLCWTVHLYKDSMVFKKSFNFHIIPSNTCKTTDTIMSLYLLYSYVHSLSVDVSTDRETCFILNSRYMIFKNHIPRLSFYESLQTLLLLIQYLLPIAPNGKGHHHSLFLYAKNPFPQ